MTPQECATITRALADSDGGTLELCTNRKQARYAAQEVWRAVSAIDMKYAVSNYRLRPAPVYGPLPYKPDVVTRIEKHVPYVLEAATGSHLRICGVGNYGGHISLLLIGSADDTKADLTVAGGRWYAAEELMQRFRWLPGMSLANTYHDQPLGCRIEAPPIYFDETPSDETPSDDTTAAGKRAGVVGSDEEEDYEDDEEESDEDEDDDDEDDEEESDEEEESDDDDDCTCPA